MTKQLKLNMLLLFSVVKYLLLKQKGINKRNKPEETTVKVTVIIFMNFIE